MQNTIEQKNSCAQQMINETSEESYELESLLYLQAMKAKEEYPAQVALNISDFKTSYPL